MRNPVNIKNSLTIGVCKLRIKSDAGFDSIRVILPEVLSLIATVVTVILCTVIPHIHHTQPAQEEAESHQSFHRSERSFHYN